MPAVNTLATLQANPLLNHAFTEAELRLFATHLRIGEFGAGMPIMQEGEPANRMMFLISGEADVISNGVRLARLKPRSFFWRRHVLPGCGARGRCGGQRPLPGGHLQPR